MLIFEKKSQILQEIMNPLTNPPLISSEINLFIKNRQLFWESFFKLCDYFLFHIIIVWE